MKRCSKCGAHKPLDGFYKDRTRKDGRSPICRDCRTAARNTPEAKAYYAAWKSANLERVKVNNRQSRLRKDRDAERERLKRYRYENHLYVLERERNTRARNIERERATKKRWADANPEKVRQLRRRTNDSRRGMRPSAAAESFVHVLRNDPCAYCGDPADEADHIEPVIRGGTGEWDNLTAACGPCNRRKNRTPLLIFLLRRTKDFTPV